jgi:8-oxo-dGTP diphosphatase
MEEMTCINVAAAFFVVDKKVLVVQRSRNGDEPLKWEFPGGKLEGDETFDEAMIREFYEEFNTKIEVIQEMGSIEVEKKDKFLLLMFFLVEGNVSDLKLKIHEDIKYVTYDELIKLDLCDADKEFVMNYEKEIKNYID